MDLSLDTLHRYGTTAIPSHDDLVLQHDDLYDDGPVDDYDLMSYQIYFPETRAAPFTDIQFAERYPASLRRAIHYYHDGGTVDMDEAAEALPPHDDLDAEHELEHYLWDDDARIFVTDDHNHALAAWIAAYNDGMLDGETTLLHIDRHEDMNAPDLDALPDYPPASVEQAERFIGAGLWIDEFIRPAMAWDIVDRIEMWGVGATGMGAPASYDPDTIYEVAAGNDSLILDVDLDVYSGIMGDVEAGRYRLDDVHRAVADASMEADITTVATSPGYLDQEDAPHLLERIAAQRDRGVIDRVTSSARTAARRLRL